MGSMAMALFPGDVRMDLRESGSTPAFGGLPFRTSSQADFGGVTVHVYLDFDEVTVNGVMGDTTLSSAEVGRKLLDHVVEIGSKFVHEFAGMPTRIEDPPGPRTVRAR
jgi:creatinine amidohydrolase/Fe(II)-dependent formamide hydrolase-like protein